MPCACETPIRGSLSDSAINYKIGNPSYYVSDSPSSANVAYDTVRQAFDIRIH
jgi:hypothetical protein